MTMDALDRLTHYEVLEVPKTATCSDIRRAYRLKALKHHPDKDSGEHATARFQRVQRAYEVLNSAQRRFLYDAGIRDFAAHEAFQARNEAALQKAAEYRDSQRSLLRERLAEACRTGVTFEVMKLLRNCNSSDINTVDDMGRTPLMYAAEGRHTQVVNLLVLYQADVNIRNAEGWTPIMFVIGSVQDADADDAAPCLLALLNAKADSNAKTSSGVTPLLLACAAGSLPIVQGLLSHGADTNLAGEAGVSPLALATDGGHVAIISELLRAAASVDFRDAVGKTALMSASAVANRDVVAMLLEADANPQTRAEDGSTALLYAVESFGNECLSCPSDHSTDELKASRARDVASLLLSAQADPDAAAEDGRSPLGLAQLAGDSSLINMLLNGKQARILQAVNDTCRAGGA
eukprot:TRINITY_DN108359_c0_g1_i1.p1 TRINITY_DN108359_c0_g1~~TRINITY_DN108359_c0_g1_i1.p1  ORF type:complete len:421 (-),score=75.17 TRINITY_DN108359_c0_g1_i1:8-1225(-)